MPRHRFNNFPREELADGTDANERGGLEVLDGREDLRILGGQIEMIKGLAARQLVGVGQFVCSQARTAGHNQSLGVEQPDLLPSLFLSYALLYQRRNDQAGEASGCGPGAQ